MQLCCNGDEILCAHGGVCVGGVGGGRAKIMRVTGHDPSKKSMVEKMVRVIRFVNHLPLSQNINMMY